MPPANVAFTVRLAREVTLSNNKTLPFRGHDVITNVAEAYNTTDSTFYCPQSGLYYFHAMICSQKSRKARAMFVKNDILNDIGFIYAEDQNNYDCAGNGVVSHLSQGDTVWMKSFLESYFDTNTYFTGMFVHK